MIVYRIPITQLKQSTNKIYAGLHWSKRSAFKDNVLSYALGFCRPIQKPRSFPVSIRYRFTFRGRQLDTLNTAFIAKCFEDALRAVGILPDDTPEYVAETILEVPRASAEQRKKESEQLGRKTRQPNEDWLIITIQPYEHHIE